jgi:hypothetical protein
MRRIRILYGAILGVGAVLAAVSVSAHHSFSAQYDEKKPISVTGTITEMVWTNPHSWLYLNVSGPNGIVKKWGVELGNANGLYRRGWRKTDLPVGVTVTVKGHLAKDGTLTVHPTTVTLASGEELFAGSPGRRAAADAQQEGGRPAR